MSEPTHQITVILTAEQYELLEMFAAEMGIEDLSAALPQTLTELVKVYDQLWDMLFAKSTAPLYHLAKREKDQ